MAVLRKPISDKAVDDLTAIRAGYALMQKDNNPNATELLLYAIAFQGRAEAARLEAIEGRLCVQNDLLARIAVASGIDVDEVNRILGG